MMRSEKGSKVVPRLMQTVKSFTPAVGGAVLSFSVTSRRFFLSQLPLDVSFFLSYL
jgi:hypothetical protein